MSVVTEVVLDKEGRVTLPPDALEVLQIASPENDGYKVRLLCTVQDRNVVLAQPETAQPAPEEQDWLDQQHGAFLRSPLGQYILAEVEKAGGEEITIEQVREALSGIEGSLAAEIIAEREERLRDRRRPL